LYFYDTDIDCISEKSDEHPMAKFVKAYFDYDF